MPIRKNLGITEIQSHGGFLVRYQRSYVLKNKAHLIRWDPIGNVAIKSKAVRRLTMCAVGGFDGNMTE